MATGRQHIQHIPTIDWKELGTIILILAVIAAVIIVFFPTKMVTVTPVTPPVLTEMSAPAAPALTINTVTIPTTPAEPIVAPQPDIKPVTTIVTQASTPTSFGNPPPQEFYPTMSEGYPYVASLPAGTQGVRVTYNYVVEQPQMYSLNIRVENTGNKPITKFYFSRFLKNGDTILNPNIDDGHFNSHFPLQPGDSTVLKMSNTSVEPGFGGRTDFQNWTVDVEVTYLKS